MATPHHNEPRSDGEQKPTVPSISLPKGGGAIRGMGEKFATNPVTGTGSMSVPIATSPGRSGFGPQLSLSYDSASGNSTFGFGWSLALPAISRKTDKGLPQYRDAEDSDVFILSGAEDLVPLLVQNAPGDWEPENLPPRTVNGLTYWIRRYRPRIEGLFARIDEAVRVVPIDLLGNGTACLVWLSPLAGDARRQMRYVDLMGGKKPHLLVKTVNNLGAETRVDYAPSTKFYLLDKRDDRTFG